MNRLFVTMLLTVALAGPAFAEGTSPQAVEPPVAPRAAACDGSVRTAPNALIPGTIKAFDPQPDPPGTMRSVSPQPSPPGSIQGFNPQPEPPKPPSQYILIGL